MLTKLLHIFSIIFGFWSRLDDETKERIIESVVNAFSAIFRNMYREAQRKRSEAEEAKGETA